MTSGREVEVRLLELPTHVHEHAQAHSAGLTREFRLLAEQVRGDADQAEGVEDVPTRLLELVAVLGERYSSATEEQDDLIWEAHERGQAALAEVVYRVPAEVAGAATALGALLDEADEFCRSGQHLLTVVSPPEVVRYRHWYLEEFVRQIGGEQPVPWPAYQAERADG